MPRAFFETIEFGLSPLQAIASSIEFVARGRFLSQQAFEGSHVALSGILLDREPGAGGIDVGQVGGAAALLQRSEVGARLGEARLGGGEVGVGGGGLGVAPSRRPCGRLGRGAPAAG